MERIVEKLVTQDCPKPQPPVPRQRKKETDNPQPTGSKIEQHGTGNGAVGGSITTAPCTNVQVGGNGNQATTNCDLSNRHLSEQQIIDLKNLAVPPSVKLSMIMTSDSTGYGNEIEDALQIKDWQIGFFGGGKQPQGVTIQIRGTDQSYELL